MIVYIIGVIISILFAIVASRVKTKAIKRLLFIVSFMPLFIISAIRYNVGTDYLYRYFKIFNIIKSGGTVPDLEIGFVYLNKLCLVFSNKFYSIFILTSFIIMALFYYIIYKKSEYYWLSILILFLELFYFQSMNIIRQYISILIIFFCTYMFMFNNKKIKYFLGVLIAYTFHTSSIICLILPFLKKKKYFKVVSVIVLSLIIIFLGIFFSQSILKSILNTKYLHYLFESYNRSDIRLLPLIINFVIYLILDFLYEKKKYSNNKINEYDNFYINVQAISTICFALGGVHYLFFRLAYFFSVFNIISIPYFIKNSLNSKKDKQLVILILIVVLLVNIIYSNIIHNDEEVLPYHTIYELNI